MNNKDDLPFSQVVDQLFQSERVPVALVYRLSDMAPEEMELLMERWPDQPEARRQVITRHMADISEENFVVDFGPLLSRLLADPSSAVRLAALDGLWDTSSITVVNPIIRMMEGDPDGRVRASAAATLGHFVLMGEWGQISDKVAGRIVDALLAQLDDASTSAQVWRASLESLGGSAHPRVPELIEQAYRSGDEGLQLSAVFAMGRSADSRWLPLVRDEMSNSSAEMRLEAARAAGGIGAGESVDDLIGLLDDDDIEVQLAAVTALGLIGSDQAYETLKALSQDPDAGPVMEAVEAALEEIEWLGAEIDLALFDWDEDNGPLA